MTQTPRREFLKSSACLTGAAVMAAGGIARAAGDANDRIRVAVVGLGGRGRVSHCAALLEMAKENVEIAALCDCDENRMQLAATFCEEKSGKRPATVADYRQLLEDKSIDAVALATPNHWHALQTIWACQAGKDVYVEKPASHNIFEGRKMVEAARKYQRIVQHGTQCRTSPKIREGIEKLQAGAIGRVYMARGIAYKVRAGGRRKAEPVPAGMNWDQLGRPGPDGAVQQAGHRPLAVPEELRQRRDRRPGRPPARHHPLGTGPGDASHQGPVDGRPLRASRRRRRHARQPGLRLRVCRQGAAGHLRDPRLVHQLRGRHGNRVSRSSTIATWWA